MLGRYTTGPRGQSVYQPGRKAVNASDTRTYDPRISRAVCGNFHLTPKRTSLIVGHATYRTDALSMGGVILMYESNGRSDVMYVRLHRPRTTNLPLATTLRADVAALFLLVSAFWGVVLYLALQQLG